MSSTNPIIVLADNPSHPLFQSWLATIGHPVEGLTYAPTNHDFSPETGLIVTADCYHEPRVTQLRRAAERGIPTLILADGILEYRNTWEHPQLPAGSLFQPVLGHKIACLGRSQARILESWHNGNRCEVTGSPRFDGYAGKKCRQRGANEPFRVLVMTALTPYFTPEQQKLVKQSLLDLKAAFTRKSAPGAVRLEPVWRLTQGLDREIGVDMAASGLAGRDLIEVLGQVDAVITTPSTTMLEAMLWGLPVAVLDYCNTPHYVPSAWRITAAAHVASTLAELANPPAPKLLFQDTTLHDALECTTPATPRLQQLALQMIAIGQDARRAGQTPVFPNRMVAVEGAEQARAEERFVLSELYPDQPQFVMSDARTLQVEIGHLRQHAAAVEQRAQAIRQGSTQLIQLTVAWKSRLEAGNVLAQLGQGAEAVKQLLAGVKAIESCQNPPVMLDALLAIGARLSDLDEGRARYLLGIADQLAGQLGNAEARRQAQQHLAKLPGATVGTV
ncbi:MAG: hypothetical protein ABI222_11765 [Opitutaceae bacterium]